MSKTTNHFAEVQASAFVTIDGEKRFVGLNIPLPMVGATAIQYIAQLVENGRFSASEMLAAVVNGVDLHCRKKRTGNIRAKLVAQKTGKVSAKAALDLAMTYSPEQFAAAQKQGFQEYAAGILAEGNGDLEIAGEIPEPEALVIAESYRASRRRAIGGETEETEDDA